jgi:hypothetical protein
LIHVAGVASPKELSSLGIQSLVTVYEEPLDHLDDTNVERAQTLGVLLLLQIMKKG